MAFKWLQILSVVTHITPLHSAMESADGCGQKNASGALAKARLLEPPPPRGVADSEFEGAKFWETHQTLLEQAWQEHGRAHPHIYKVDSRWDDLYLTNEFTQAQAIARSHGDEGPMRGLFTEIVGGVYATNSILSRRFTEILLHELEHKNRSGIPQRRPNGMNRYGAILEDIGLGPMVDQMVARFVRPLAQMLFPQLVTQKDASHSFGFIVRYRLGEDVELSAHRDASVVTLNLCLGSLHSPIGHVGGNLSFVEGPLYMEDWGEEAKSALGEVQFTPGMVVMHSGQHKHMANPLLAGERVNLIIWLFAEHGDVRVAPYPVEEQLNAQERWGSANKLGIFKEEL